MGKRPQWPYSEKASKDYWTEEPSTWTRHHVQPRRTLFHPGACPGPDLHALQTSRETVTPLGAITDQWNGPSASRVHGDDPWTGKTIFQKQTAGASLDASQISDSFIQMVNCSSQGGFVLLFYDKRLESEDQPHMVSVTTWKSHRLKRKTVNTLSAECQSMIHGVGQVHWHRYLLLELLGHDLSASDWELRLSSIPFVSVVDSKSLFDCLNKQMCTFSQVEDKRTAIDIAILRDDLQRTGGHIRWVEGQNMLADPLTKKMPGDFLRSVCNRGLWTLSAAGFERMRGEHEVLWILGKGT